MQTEQLKVSVSITVETIENLYGKKIVEVASTKTLVHDTDGKKRKIINEIEEIVQEATSDASKIIHFSKAFTDGELETRESV